MKNERVKEEYDPYNYGYDETPKQKRETARSDIDLNLLLTNTVWGADSVSPELRERLAEYYLTETEKGRVVEKAGLWGMLSFYTRDMRLGNLNGTELNFCRYYLDLASDFLNVDMVKPFLICISRVASVLETSQSKSGFLRKNMNTLRSENKNTLEDAKKKTIFGRSRGGED